MDLYYYMNNGKGYRHGYGFTAKRETWATFTADEAARISIPWGCRRQGTYVLTTSING